MASIEAAYEKFCRVVFPPTTEQDIARLEQNADVAFPPEYREFLLNYNGGYFTRPRIEIPEDVPADEHLEYMNGIGAPHRHAELATPGDLAIFDDNQPPVVVPIGGTERGSLILLITHEEDYGGILLRTFTTSYWLCRGIEEFFSLLQES
jgi:hypothetical protein